MITNRDMSLFNDFDIVFYFANRHFQRVLAALILFPGLLVVIEPDTVPATTKFREVTTVAGSVGQILCPITSFDETVMVLWYKGSSGAPIYSYDARNKEVEPRQMTLREEWGNRLYFRIWPSNRRYPALMIQNVTRTDGGIYRCRVDYVDAPTTNSVTRLRVIEPPTRLEIRDTSSTRLSSDQNVRRDKEKHSDPSVIQMGPYKEGQNVTLVCSAYGGTPPPEVVWYRNGELVDASYSLAGTEYTINEMTIWNLGRNHSIDVFSCQANNNNESEALRHKVVLEIYLGVAKVELEIPTTMTVGTGEYTFVCKIFGAYPTVKVEFWRNSKKIASLSRLNSISRNVSIATIKYKPEINDDGASVMCKAENPWVSRKSTIARKDMNIKYVPVVVLRHSRNLAPNITEGISINLECHVKSNPPAHTIRWFHEGEELDPEKESYRFRINGMTLFISYLSYQSGGDFNCEATSDVGKGMSNTISIEPRFSPKCIQFEPKVISLRIGETWPLACSVFAWPSDLTFHWARNRSGVMEAIESQLPPALTDSIQTKINKFERNARSDLGSTKSVANASLTTTTTSFNSTFPAKTDAKKNVAEQSKTLVTTSSLVENGKDKPAANKNDTYHDLVRTEVEEQGKSINGMAFISSDNNNQNLPHSNFSNGTCSNKRCDEVQPIKVFKRSINTSFSQSHKSSMEGKFQTRRFRDRIRHSSSLLYTVKADEDYGQIVCYCVNSIGMQAFPCLFDIVRSKETKSEQNRSQLDGKDMMAEESMFSERQLEFTNVSSNENSNAGDPESILTPLFNLLGIIFVIFVIAILSLALVSLVIFIVQKFGDIKKGSTGNSDANDAQVSNSMPINNAPQYNKEIE